MTPEIKILLVEHEPADLELIQHELKMGKVKYISEHVQNEKDYTLALQRFVPDIILSDYTFPSFHGMIAFKIRQELAPDTPFIFVSGTIGEEKSIELIKTGVTDYALKDNLGNLPVKVLRALKEARAKKEKDRTAVALNNALSDINKIMDSSPDVICTVDEAGYFTQVSAASEMIWGYKPQELIGQRAFDYVYPADLEETETRAGAVMQGKNLSNFENRYIHKNGSLVPMVWSARWNEKERLRYAVGRDATEKKRAEKSLEAERQRFFKLFLQAPLSIGVLKGPEHIYEMVNPPYLELIGRDDIIGKSVREVLPEVINQGFIDILNEVYETGNPFFASEMMVKLDKAGNGKLSECYLNIAYQAYKNDSGAVESIFFFTVDVTEQILSRKKIEESEKQYRQIVETAQEGIWLIDEHNDTILVNKKMAEIMEYQAADMIGKKHHTFMDAEWKKKALEQIEDRKMGLSENHDFKFISRSGKEVWTNISTNPVFDDTGTYKGALAMVTDITERKKAEADLIKRDSQLRLATEMAKLGYWEYDVLNDLFTFTNQFYSIFRTTVEKVGGFSMSSARYAELFVHPEDVDVVRRSISEAVASSDESFSFKTEHRIIYEDGQIGHISVHFNIVKDKQGKTIRNYGVNQDITERKNSEEKIRESNQRFKYVAKATSDAIWDWDLHGKNVYWGEGFQHLFGYSISDLKKENSSWTDYIHSEEREKVIGRINEFIVGTETKWEDQYRYLKKDGSYAYVIDKGFILRDKNNMATRMIGAKQDITKTRQSEILLNEMNKNLQRQTKELAVSNAELEQFAYVTSHDLQEPLRMVTSFLTQIENKYGDLLDERGKKYIGFAVDGARRMRHIILDLLEFSRIGRTEESSEHLDLNELVEEIKILFRKEMREKKATILFGVLPVINSFRAPIRQVFQNLISNALKYSRAGIPSEICIAVTDLKTHWQFSFSDNGIGIDSEYFDKIFIIFQRLHGKEEFPGTGMGLAVTKKIIENYGGKIWLVSEEGKGSVFHFTLLKTS